MRKFLTRVFGFLVLLFLVLNVVGFLLMKFNLQAHSVENSRIYRCLEKSRTPHPQSEVFVFGDSVANQMYPPEECNDKINSLAMVMPSTMAGQYFLIKRFLEVTDVKGKRICLILTPGTFGGDLNHDSSFHYVFKPFYNSEYAPWEEPQFSNRLASTTVARLSQLPMVKCSNWNPPTWMSYVKPSEEVEHNPEPKGRIPMSHLSAYYLKRIESLVKKHNATLELLPTVMRRSKSDRGYSRLKKSVRALEVDHLFEQYFDRFVYFDDELFADQVHLKDHRVLGHDVLKLLGDE